MAFSDPRPPVEIRYRTIRSSSKAIATSDLPHGATLRPCPPKNGSPLPPSRWGKIPAQAVTRSSMTAAPGDFFAPTLGQRVLISLCRLEPPLHGLKNMGESACQKEGIALDCAGLILDVLLSNVHRLNVLRD
jgi:hypothetical protein